MAFDSDISLGPVLFIDRMEARDRFFYGLSFAGALAILSSTMAKNPVLVPFARSLGADTALLGLIAAASTLPGILVSLPAGSLSDLLGRRKIMYGAGFVFASAPLLYLIVSTPSQLMVVRFYHGFATAIFGTVASAAIVDNFPDLKAGRLSFYSSATVVGRGLAPFIGGAIIVLTANNYRDVYWAVALAGISAFLAIVAVYGRGWDGGRKEGRGTLLREQLRSIITNRRAVVASGTEAAQYLAFGAFEVFSIDYAFNGGLDPLWWTAIAGAQLVTVAAVKPVMGRLSDRYGRNRFIVAGLLICAAAVLFYPLTLEPVLLVALAAIFGLGFSSVTSSTQALVSDLCVRSGSGSTMGFLHTVMDVGQFTGPVVISLVIGNSLWYLGGFWSIAAVLAAGAGAFSLTFRRNAPPAACPSR
ncbi:MAG: MFS transporter [Methanomassiliicoccus sp.]|nr:MFS transporter [Methanomassiliicoccus sp.]